MNLDNDDLLHSPNESGTPAVTFVGAEFAAQQTNNRRPLSRHSRYTDSTEYDFYEQPQLEETPIIHIFIDPNTGRLISTDERFNEIDPRLRHDDPESVETHQSHVQEAANEGEIEELFMSFYRIRRLRRELESMGVRFPTEELIDDRQTNSDGGTVIEHDSPEIDLAQYFNSSHLVEMLRSVSLVSESSSEGSNNMNSQVMISLPESPSAASPLTVNRMQSTSAVSGITTPNRFEPTNSPQVPSVLATPPHLASTPTGFLRQSPFESTTSINEEVEHDDELNQMEAQQNSARSPSSDMTLFNQQSDVSILRERITTLETTFQERLGSISRFHRPSAHQDPESAANRWRRLVSSRREMFERMWRQEVEFWSRVEERLDDRNCESALGFDTSLKLDPNGNDMEISDNLFVSSYWNTQIDNSSFAVMGR